MSEAMTALEVLDMRRADDGGLLLHLRTDHGAGWLVLPPDIVAAVIVGMSGMPTQTEQSAAPSAAMTPRSIAAWGGDARGGLIFRLEGGWDLPISLAQAQSRAEMRRQLDHLDLLMAAGPSQAH